MSTTKTPLRRSPEEIQTKITNVANTDFFGVIRERLIFALPFDDAKEYLVDGTKPSDFLPAATHTIEDVTAEAKDYLSFAVDKMRNERGLSAARSIDHYHGLIFLAFDDATLQDFNETDYGHYGRKQLAKAADLFGLSDYFNELVGEDQ